MTPSRALTLDQLPDAFEEARGKADDKKWAQLAIGRFRLDNVNQSLVAKELTKALGLVRTSGESPEELYGDPFVYVATQTEQWRADGDPFEPIEPTTSWRDVPAVAACTATFTVFVVMILEMFAGNWTTEYTLGKVLMPLLVGITAVVVITAFERLLMKTRRLWAVTGTAAIVVVAATIIVATFIIGNDRPLFTGSLWWYAALVAAHVLITLATARYFPGGEAPAANNQNAANRAEDDDDWAAQLGGILRLRAEATEKEVRSAVAEARQYAASRGTSLNDEFGPPGLYASRLPRSTAGKQSRERWRRVAWIVAVPSFGYLAFEGLQDGLEWGNVRWIMAIAFAAACFTVVSFIGKTRSGK